MSKLKCYRVGEFDLAAAYSESEAIEIVINEIGICRDDITDVCECDDTFMSKGTVDEDGIERESWGETFARMSEPGYIGGWT